MELRSGKKKGFFGQLFSLFFGQRAELPKFIVSYDPHIEGLGAGTLYRLMRPHRWEMA